MAEKNGRKWQIEVDSGVCIGSGMCTGIAPGHFRLEGNRSRPVDEFTGEADAVLDAAENCPVEAILVRHAETGARLAPVEGQEPVRP